jgi:hypothetical protein
MGSTSTVAKPTPLFDDTKTFGDHFLRTFQGLKSKPKQATVQPKPEMGPLCHLPISFLLWILLS